MNFNDIHLLNGHSYLEQKMNLTGNTKDSPIYEKELFLIPKFTVVGFPMQNLQKSSYYYIGLQILEAYCYDLDDVKEIDGGLLSDVTFQYDLNYSNVKQASGQLLISKSIKWKLFFGLYLVLLENDKIGPYANITHFHMLMKTYKLILPAAAVKKNSINTLNYSFNGKRPANFKDIRHINNKHNYGSLNFYFNNNPQYQLQIRPKIFTTNNFNLEIKNPIILTTRFSHKWCYSLFSKTIIPNVTIGGESRLDEVFRFSGNNINTASIVPMEMKHYLISYFPDFSDMQNWCYDKETILNKILVFSNNFNLQQNTCLNISEEGFNFYQNNKIPALLLRDENNDFKDNIDRYYLQFASAIFNNITKKVVLNDEIAKNQFDLPWFANFHFTISIPFTFETFFKYDIVLKFIEESDEQIIGGSYHSIFIKKLVKNNNEDWVTTTNFTITYDEILKFYASDNFCFIDYQYLNRHQVE